MRRWRHWVIIAGLAQALCLSAAAQEKKLTVLIHPKTFDGWPALKELSEDFERRHNVRVEVLNAAGGTNETEKIKFHLLSGLPLDVTWIDVTEFGAYLDEGILLDLQPYFDADPTFRREDFFKAPLEAFTDDAGHLYGLPSTFTPYVMYYNRDILRRDGVAIPEDGWTWDDLLEACRKTTKDRDGDGFVDQWGLSLTQWLQALTPWLWQGGAAILSKDRSRSVINSPATVRALTFLKRILHEEKLASFDATYEAQMTQGLFQAGAAAFYGPVGYWEVYRFQHIRDFEWDVVPLPRDKVGATTIALRSYVVPSRTRHPQLAYEFVRALAGQKMQRTLARIGNGVPGLKSAAYSEDFLKPDVPPTSEQVFLDVVERGEARLMPRVPSWAEVEAFLGAELQGTLILNDLEPSEAAMRMEAKVNEYLARQQLRQSRPRIATWLIPLVAVAVACTLLCLFFLSRSRQDRIHLRRERGATAFLLPWGLGFLLFTVAAMVGSLMLSFSEWSPLRSISDIRYAGGSNWSRMAADETVHDALWVTLKYALAAVPSGLVVALGLAMLLLPRFRGVNVARTAMYLPTLISPVVVGSVWRWVLDTDRGGVNRMLHAGGLEGVPWLTDGGWVLWSFVLMNLWMVGGQTLVFLAALQGLPKTYEEAAVMDGAGSWSRFRYVTLPLLTPVILFNLVMGIINAFQLFAQPFIMTQGGPGNASRFLALHIYNVAFRHLEVGYASAIAWVMFGLLLIVTLVVMGTSKFWVHYQGSKA